MLISQNAIEKTFILNESKHVFHRYTDTIPREREGKGPSNIKAGNMHTDQKTLCANTARYTHSRQSTQSGDPPDEVGDDRERREEGEGGRRTTPRFDQVCQILLCDGETGINDVHTQSCLVGSVFAMLFEHALQDAWGYPVYSYYIINVPRLYVSQFVSSSGDLVQSVMFPLPAPSSPA